MRKYLHKKLLLHHFLMLFAALMVTSASFAQTPGLIVRPASTSGAAILDPNSDGYVSTAATGFPGASDVGAGISEIPYRPFPTISSEPLGDLQNGAAGGHVDLAPPSPVQAYFNGQNLMFRFRVGGTSTAIRGYSVLIDNNNSATGTGANPGFEYEVLFSSNSDVKVIAHNGSSSQTIFTGAATQYAQRAVAASIGSGDTDFFYDFFVPLTVFGNGISASTPLRMVGSTVNKAQGALIDPTAIADVGGINYQAYNADAPAAWRALLGIFPPTTPAQLQTPGIAPVASTAPFLISPITTTSTSISGTSIEAPGSLVTVIRTTTQGATQTTTQICGGANQLTCPTVGADGTWTLTNIPAGTLTAGSIITARVTAPGETISPVSNAVTVTTVQCTPPAAPRITGTQSAPRGPNKVFTIIPSINGPQVLTFYNTTNPTQPTVVHTSEVLNLTAGSTYVVAGFVLDQTITGNYQVTTTPTSANVNAPNCTSLLSNTICAGGGSNTFTVNPNILTITGVIYGAVTQTITSSPTPTQVPANLASIIVSIDYGGVTSGSLVLYRNGIATNVKEAITGNATTRTLNVTDVTPAITAGDILTVRTEVASTGCTALSNASANPLSVVGFTTTPTINQPDCGLVTTLSGTSTEPAGTVIQFYLGGTAGADNGTLVTRSGTTTPITATVTSTGVWAADLTAAAGGGLPAGTAITARALATGSIRSVNSNAVTATPNPTGVLTVNSPITEGATTVSGTAPASANGATITLYIEGTPFPTTATVNNGAWTVSGISSLELFAGASVSATFTPTAGGCESALANPVIVTCNTPATTFTLAPVTTTVCGGTTVSVTLSGSEFGISYRLLLPDGTESGTSVVGTGGPITLVSGPLTNLTISDVTRTLRYRARRVSGTNCDAISTNTTTVTVRPQPVTTGLVITNANQSICPGQAVSFSITGTNSAYNYQFLNEATGLPVGSPTPGATNAIIVQAGQVNTFTTFSLRVTPRTGTEPCSITLPGQATAAIRNPSITNIVFPEASNICVGGATTIFVATEQGTNFRYVIRRRLGATNNPSVDPALIQTGVTDINGNFTGTGGLVGITTGPLTTGPATYYVQVTETGTNTCGTLTLLNTATVQVNNGVEQADAGLDTIACGSTVVLQGNDVTPGIGTWGQVSGPSTARFINPNNPTSSVEGLIPGGVYVFEWTARITCGASTSTSQDRVTITLNCPATYTIAVPNYRNLYTNGNVLATASDSDGVITSATITMGSLPPGTALSQEAGTVGNIFVMNAAALEEGVYPLSITLTDEFGVPTNLSIIIRILGNAPVVVPLPVELVYFTAVVRDNQAHLQWLTASEDDNDRFEVQRSQDGKSFEIIGTVKGQGTTSLETKYEYTDRTPVQGTVYYRLKQVDFDGDFAFSNVIAVNAKGLANELTTQVYPNPFQDRVKISLTSPNDQTVELVLYDLNGRRVMTQSLEVEAGLNKLELDLQKLGKGMYILKILGQGMDSTTKIMKN
ncbi:T9SS type A sorting domain-containing protein [Pontibacter roseus]|uniref:T9SS type A sorting domain-containing protein n=1 Tax=Pontibacter roseus TaxID=336989 RepID=UPI001FE06594|nr:T9SS type A sorting domain-containing protein [Pontibacter roseus]